MVIVLFDCPATISGLSAGSAAASLCHPPAFFLTPYDLISDVIFAYLLILTLSHMITVLKFIGSSTLEK